MAKCKKSGRLTSTHVTSSTVTTQGQLHTSRLSVTQIRRERIAYEAEQRRRLQELTSRERINYAEAHLEAGTTSGLYEWDISLDLGPSARNDSLGPISDEEDEEVNEVERGAETSRDGYAVDNAQREVVESFYHQISPYQRHYKRGKRSRLFRNRAMYAEWDAQAPQLVAAYLQWKHDPTSVTDVVVVTGDAPTRAFFEVTVVDIKERFSWRRIPQGPNELANVSLLKTGSLGCSPTDPSVAITLECLELYHQIRRRQSSFSIQAMCKVLCALQNVTYSPVFRQQLSIAFDVYLDLLRRVQYMVNETLGRNTPNWRLQNACPACSFKLEEEPILVPARLQAMDGNMSLKRMDGSGLADKRTFISDYHIPPSRVDQFKDDVRLRPGASSTRRTGTEGALPYGNDHTVCTDNWAAAHATSEDTIQVFEQTGAFVSACRHGLIEMFAEMRKSGELAKYGLATLDKLLEVFQDDQGVGCDIACSFTSTVQDSSLSELARVHRLLLALNAFHGYAHGRSCQLRCHPMFISGLGLEDLETCERVFSASNSVARLVRHASYYHWLQFIDLHFQQWDDDKYLELSKFLYNNYRQALSIIAEYTPVVEEFKRLHGYHDCDFQKWHDEEAEFLATAAKEPEADLLAIAYVEALEKLTAANAIWGRMTTVPWQDYTPATLAPSGTLPASVQSKTNAHEAERRAALRNLQLAMNVANDLERRMGLGEPWTRDHPDYCRAAKYLANRRFIRVVDELEGLIVARLFELAKANLMGTCVKMRKHISKAITRRGAAIHTALEKYNSLAPLQDPPCPCLDKSALAGYALLADFELLKRSPHDILERPWATPANREVATKHFKIVRAREEIIRLDVEIRRLQTWVHLEDQFLHRKSEELVITDPLIAYRVRDLYQVRRRVNNVHRARLAAIHRLPGYSGSKTVGVKVGSMDLSSLDTEPQENTPDSEIDGDEEMEIIEDDTAYDEVIRLADVLENSHL